MLISEVVYLAAIMGNHAVMTLRFFPMSEDGNRNSQRLYRNRADHLGAKAHITPDAGAHDEPGDVCHYGPDPSFHSYSRCFSQTEPNIVPARHRWAGGTFTSGRAEF